MGRDHSCETCGRGGFNDPGGCVCFGPDATGLIDEGDSGPRTPRLEGWATEAREALALTAGWLGSLAEVAGVDTRMGNDARRYATRAREVLGGFPDKEEE